MGVAVSTFAADRAGVADRVGVADKVAGNAGHFGRAVGLKAVSYTHLTLPTKA